MNDDDIVISVENITVSRGRRTILRDVSCTVSRGEQMVIVGPNGAGKTTLLLAALGLVRCTSGCVRVSGVALAQQTRRQLAQAMSYVPQQHDSFSGFTVEDMVRAGRHAHRGALTPLSATDRDVIDQAIGQTDLSPLRSRVVGQLSGGEQQKVWLAAALAQQSPILLLDEPGTALDPKHHLHLVELLSSLRKDGQTVIVVSHDLNLAAALDGRVLALQRGTVAFDGMAREFLTAGHAERVFDVKFNQVTTPQGVLRVWPDG